MSSSRRQWLLLIVLALVTSSLCGFANEVSVGEENLKETHIGAKAAIVGGADVEFGSELPVELHRSLRFEPSHLDFGSWAVGTVRSQTVTLVNHNNNRSVYLSSVSGRIPAFYSSFFETKVVPPKGNTTFNVVFLPREQGVISTDLHIHTSFGEVRLLVRGEGRACPYRLKPIVGIRAPLNATLTPEIHMYNPHERTLQILEVYSSGGQFQLELPSGDQEAPQGLWEIPPYSTKPVIRIRFHGNIAGNHTAYIRIKIGELGGEGGQITENVLVIPVEFEIMAQYGLYVENPLLDFGFFVANSDAAPVRCKLQIRHSKTNLQPNELTLESISDVPGVTFNPKNSTVTLDPQLFTLSSSSPSLSPTSDERLSLRLSSVYNASRSQHVIELLIRAEIFKGTLHYDRNMTTFVVPSSNFPDDEERLLVIHHDFEHPLTLLNVSLAQNDSSRIHFKLNDFQRGLVLQPFTSFKLLHLRLAGTAKDLDNHYETKVFVHTNISRFEIPVVICTGRLYVTTHNKGRWMPNDTYSTELHMGAVPLTEMSHGSFIVLQNRNPVPVKLGTWDFQSPQGVYFQMIFRGCIKAASLQSIDHKGLDLAQAKFKLNSHLDEGDIGVFEVAVKSHSVEHNAASLKIWSTYEEITISVRFTSWLGKLEVDQEKVHFENCFPRKLCVSELSIRSTFKYPIHVRGVNFTDAGLRFEDISESGSEIAPDSVTTVGRVYFEPALLCGNRCYISQSSNGSKDAIDVAFPPKIENANNNRNFDESELRRRTELFRYLKWYFHTIEFTMDSRELGHIQLHLIIELEWPKLVRGRQVLPTTEVARMQEYSITISNPSDSPLLVDFFLADPVFAQQTQLSLPLEVVDIAPSCYLTDKPVFSLVNRAPERPLMLPPGASLSVPVRFESQEAGSYCTLLHVRNNLTLYEAVWLSARTVQSQFRFANRKPGSSTPLLFEISEQQLASACKPATRSTSHFADDQPTVLSRRVFTARNSGELPIWVEGFLIGEQPCQGYGFRVVDCSGFELSVNGSKKIEIVFKTDFTSTRVSRPLTLKTNLSYDIRYVLLAQVARTGLDQCVALLPRPPWEQRLRNAAIVLLTTMLVLVVIAVHIDYNNILLNQSAMYLARDKGQVYPTFNLRNIAMRTAPLTDRTSEGAAVKSNKEKTTAGIVTSSAEQVARRRSAKTKATTEAKGCLEPDPRCNVLLTEIGWGLDTATPMKKAQTLSERNANSKIRIETHSSPSSNGASSNDLNVKTKVKQSEKSPSDSVSCSGTNRKATQRVVKKLKGTGQQQTAEVAIVNAECPLRPNEVEPKRDKLIRRTSDKAVLTMVAESPTVAEAQELNSVETEEKSVKDLRLTLPPLEHSPPTQVTNKETNGTRKHGKTPGRERRKQSHQNTSPTTSSSSSSNSSTKRCDVGGGGERKPKLKAATSLTFQTSPSMASESASPYVPEATNCITSPWETSNQVSFSDVLQSQSGKSSIDAATKHPLPSAQESLTARHTTNGNNVELGPIGSRKSPSSTPVWEPMTNASMNMQIPRPSNATNNPSFFDSLIPGAAKYGYEEAAQQQQAQLVTITPQLYELKKVQAELQRQWQANEYILSLRQQQLQAQQQQLLQNMDAGATVNNWTQLSSPTWTPIGGGGFTQSPAWPVVSSGIVRPPPGLETNFQNNNNATHTQQQAATLVNGTQTKSSNGLAGDTDIPTFDPFGSLSSIWTDNWRQSHQQHSHDLD